MGEERLGRWLQSSEEVMSVARTLSSTEKLFVERALWSLDDLSV